MSDHDDLREAIRAMREWADSGQGNCRSTEQNDEFVRLLCNVAESTLPKTKMVEVWRVEWVTPGGIIHAEHYHFESNAQDRVRCLSEERCACIRVTGPHQQEVPA